MQKIDQKSPKNVGKPNYGKSWQKTWKILKNILKLTSFMKKNDKNDWKLYKNLIKM